MRLPIPSIDVYRHLSILNTIAPAILSLSSLWADTASLLDISHLADSLQSSSHLGPPPLPGPSVMSWRTYRPSPCHPVMNPKEAESIGSPGNNSHVADIEIKSTAMKQLQYTTQQRKHKTPTSLGPLHTLTPRCQLQGFRDVNSTSLAVRPNHGSAKATVHSLHPHNPQLENTTYHIQMHGWLRHQHRRITNQDLVAITAVHMAVAQERHGCCTGSCAGHTPYYRQGLGLCCKICLQSVATWITNTEEHDANLHVGFYT